MMDVLFYRATGVVCALLRHPTKGLSPCAGFAIAPLGTQWEFTDEDTISGPFEGCSIRLTIAAVADRGILRNHFEQQKWGDTVTNAIELIDSGDHGHAVPLLEALINESPYSGPAGLAACAIVSGEHGNAIAALKGIFP